jgi:uncharacterized protein (DUF305 family)
VGSYTHSMGPGIAKRTAVALAAVVVVVAVVALVTADDDSGEADRTSAAAPNAVQPGAPGEPSRKLSGDDAADVETPKHTAADVDFMRGMIHHHEQALVMTGYVAGRGAGRDISLLSKRLELSQMNEIEFMETWLRDRDADPAHGHGDELMPGMLTEAQLARLEASKGRRFKRLFLRGMIRHHRGALTMARRLYEDDGGMEPEIDRFVREVEADQGIEIGRMRALLAR